MDDSLLDKANLAIDQDYEEKSLVNFLRDKHGVRAEKDILFYIEFIRTGQAYRSYQKVFAPNMSRGSAAVLANRLMKKHKINFLDWLEYAGHGTDSIVQALDNLRDKDSDAYLKHMTKFGQYEVQKLEHSGKIDIPNLSIIGYEVKE